MSFAKGSWRMRRIVRNVALEMALQQRARGRRIAALREKLAVTQEDMARRLGVTNRAYQKWEAGEGVQSSNLHRLAAEFGVTVDYLNGNEPVLSAVEGTSSDTPDPFRTRSQLDRLEEKLDRVLARQAAHMAASRSAIQLLLDALPSAPELQAQIREALERAGRQPEQELDEHEATEAAN